MEEVNIKIQGSGLSYEGSTSITKAAQVIAFLNAREQVSEIIPAERAVGDYALVSPGSKISPRQALLDAGAKSNAEKIATLAHYLLGQGKSSVELQEIKVLFNKAGEPTPQNFSRDLKDAVRSNYIFESGEGRYEVTEFGSEAVRNQFALDKVRRTERKRPRQKSPDARPEIMDMELSATEEGFPAFHDLTKGMQILWVCVLADSKGIPGLTVQEIVHLIDRLKGNVTARTFTALNESNIKKGYLKTASSFFKPTHVGITKLKEHLN